MTQDSRVQGIEELKGHMHEDLGRRLVQCKRRLRAHRTLGHCAWSCAAHQKWERQRPAKTPRLRLAFESSRHRVGHSGLALLAAAFSASWAAAQTTAPADSQPSAELPAEVSRALATIEDFSFEFGQPGFYTVLEHVKTTSRSPGHTRTPIEVEDWTVLLERPADFRGAPITIEGRVGRNKAWRFEGQQHRQLGTVWQLELQRPDQPIACTVILSNEAGDIPINATIRVTGYFVMIRQYYSRTNRLRQAALVVADGPTLVSLAAPAAASGERRDWLVGVVVGATAGLVVIWMLLRRSVTRSRHTPHALQPSGRAPMSLADDLATWASEQPDLPSSDSADAQAARPSNQTGKETDTEGVDRP